MTAPRNSQPPELTAKQSRFVDEYLVDLDATKAAIRAGYSAKSASQLGMAAPAIVSRQVV